VVRIDVPIPFDAIQREFENSKGQTEGNRVPARVVRLVRRFSIVTSIFEYSFYFGIIGIKDDTVIQISFESTLVSNK